MNPQPASWRLTYELARGQGVSMRKGDVAERNADANELYERSVALGALRTALDAARNGHGQLIFVCGEAGAGKSALLRRFAHDIDGTARLLWGDCDPLFTPSPLGPFLDIADQLAGEFGELVKKGARPPRLVHALMRELGAGSVDVVVIDDLQWADEASLDLLELVGRRIGRVPALVVGSFRDDEIGPAHPLRTVLGRLATAPVTRLSLAPLSRDTVALMAARYGVDEGLLFENTGGNPFFVTEALSCGADRVPPTVRDAVLAAAGDDRDHAFGRQPDGSRGTRRRGPGSPRPLSGLRCPGSGGGPHGPVQA